MGLMYPTVFLRLLKVWRRMGNVRTSKLVLKGGLAVEKVIDKKKKKKKKSKKAATEELEATVQEEATEEGGEKAPAAETAIDTGTGFAPDGKNSKKYEELFPVETKRFGFKEPEKVKTREEALDERIKRKADRYCK